MMVSRIALVVFCLLTAFICFATLSPIQLRPDSGHLLAERFLAFVSLGAALTLAYPKRPLVALLAVCVMAVGLEFAQTLVPGRHGRAQDAIEKIAGAFAGVGLTAIAIGLWERLGVTRRKAAAP